MAKQKDVHVVFQVMNFVYSEEIDKYHILDIDKHILILLAKFYGPKGIFPSTATLAKLLRKTPTYIKMRINILDEKNIISVIRKTGKAHQYILNFLLDQSTAVDRCITPDRSTAVALPVNCSRPHRSTPVDTINIDLSVLTISAPNGEVAPEIQKQKAKSEDDQLRNNKIRLKSFFGKNEIGEYKSNGYDHKHEQEMINSKEALKKLGLKLKEEGKLQ